MGLTIVLIVSVFVILGALLLASGVNTLRWSLRQVLMVTALAGVLFALVRPIYQWEEQLKSEYTTARIIREVQSYVSAHHGRWPSDWSDIPSGESARQCVRIDFAADTARLIDEPELIQSAIAPKSGYYHTYPHAARDLDELRRILERSDTRKAQTPTEAP